MKPVIQVEGLSKKYLIKHQTGGAHYKTLRETITDLPTKLFSRAPKESREEFWALNDVSFDIMPGERVGIIGRNGAGKSTLLKLLSRITEPTKGKISLRGRVASLLEVGTGFHPELTGKENIFLNGAILGMHRNEIQRKFDEIVDFSGVENFLDTPVKRYSSGMYVRLAFAVAAHLEPEILIVDEVLAVGDAEFQKKCMGKMEEVSQGEGRTILFVSHNMAAVRQLCERGLLLQDGVATFVGAIEDALKYYMNPTFSFQSATINLSDQPDDPLLQWDSVEFLQDECVIADEIDGTLPLTVKTSFTIKQPVGNFRIFIDVNDEKDTLLIRSFHDVGQKDPIIYESGQYFASAILPGRLLGPKRYTIRLYATIHNHFNCSYPDGIRKDICVNYSERWGGPYHNEPFRSALNVNFDWRMAMAEIGHDLKCIKG